MDDLEVESVRRRLIPGNPSSFDPIGFLKMARFFEGPCRANASLSQSAVVPFFVTFRIRANSI
jgi:hypothetical protein